MEGGPRTVTGSRGHHNHNNHQDDHYHRHHDVDDDIVPTHNDYNNNYNNNYRHRRHHNHHHYPRPSPSHSSKNFFFFTLVAVVIILGLILLLSNSDFREHAVLVSGENAVIFDPRSDLPYLNPEEYSHIKIHSNSTTPDGTTSYFFETCPKLATNRRLKTVSQEIYGQHYFATIFFLNPGAIVDVTWNTETNVFFDIYRGEDNFDSGSDAVYTSGQTAINHQQGFSFTNISQSGNYYFTWESPQADLVEGAVVFNLDLAVFDTSLASANCSLYQEECRWALEKGTENCVVLDVPGDSEAYSYCYHICGKAREARFPYALVLVICLLLLIGGALLIANVTRVFPLEEEDVTQISAVVPDSSLEATFTATTAPGNDDVVQVVVCSPHITHPQPPPPTGGYPTDIQQQQQQQQPTTTATAGYPPPPTGGYPTDVQPQQQQQQPYYPPPTEGYPPPPPGGYPVVVEQQQPQPPSPGL